MKNFKKRIGIHFYAEMENGKIFHILNASANMEISEKSEKLVFTSNIQKGDHLINVLDVFPENCEEIEKEEFEQTLKLVLTEMGLVKSFEELSK